MNAINNKKHDGGLKMEPIAIVGMGCRFPGGANSPEAYWDLLASGKDAITEIPADRWNAQAFYSPNPKAPGKTVSRWGGFIDSIDRFDARFFGISPREAVHMDPQQRILLECVWQALEDGGLVPEQLEGSATGVFIGISGMEYSNLVKLDLHRIDGHTGTGVALSVAANRISYLFDLKGPSMVVDTACSSSLVAVHLACRSIWNGESTAALAGGVNAILAPDVTVTLGKGGMLSPDGRCKSFDAEGNGYVRGEGAGIVVLKPLSRALEDGDPVHALIMSTVSNQDGHTTGMPVPDADAQKRMLREACRNAGIAPHQIQYIEAHGTGTPVGDPIEANAQGEVLAENRDDQQPCFMGSVKTNIGHLESASGIASLIKVVLALKHKQIPPNLHFKRPNPNIHFDRHRLRIPDALMPWPNGSGPCLAGVNSFGFGGTNANVLLKEAPQPPGPFPMPETLRSRPVHFLPISARSFEALKNFAARYDAFLGDAQNQSDSALYNICYSAGARRGHQDYRLTVTGESAQAMREALAAFVKQEKRPQWVSGRRPRGTVSRPAFVFSGQGPQWWAMGRQLLQSEPVFNDAVQQCDSLFRRHADWSLLQELNRDEASSRIHETWFTQPAMFSLQVGLAALWRSWGIEPGAVVGHSVGEAAAAYVAGIYSLEDAVRIIYHRGRLLHAMYGKGKMAVVGLPPQEARQALKGFENTISIAAVNSPKSVTLSGDPEALDSVIRPLEAKEVFCRYLKVHYAFHSHQMEPVRKGLLESLSGIRPESGNIPFYSTVRGARLDGKDMGPGYWWENVRQPVLFYKSVENIIDDESEVFLEIGPHPVLGANISECFSRMKRQGTVLPSLRHNENDRKVLLGSLGSLYCRGHAIDWKNVYPHGGQSVPLPNYPWQRERFWHERDEKGVDPFAENVHPFLGRKMENAESSWQARVDRREYTYLGDHVVKGAMVFPGAGLIELGLAAAGHVFEDTAWTLGAVEFHNALILPRNRGLKIQTTLDPVDSSIKIHSLSDKNQSLWTLHATATVETLTGPRVCTVDPEEIQARCPEAVATEDLYSQFDRIGLSYGPAFRGIARCWKGEGEALGRIEKPPTLEKENSGYHLHPVILDAAFQVSALLISGAAGKKLFLPVGVEKVHYYGSPPESLWAHVKKVRFSANQAELDIRLYDDSGRVWAECLGFKCRALEGPKTRDLDDPENWLYEWRWEPADEKERSETSPAGAVLPAIGTLAGSIETVSLRLDNSYREKVKPELDGLAAAYIQKAFKDLGGSLKDCAAYSNGTADRFLMLDQAASAVLEPGIKILKDGNILVFKGDRWTTNGSHAQEDPEALWRTLIRKFPGYLPELNLIRTVGENYGRILKGEVEGVLKLLPGTDPVWEHFFQDAHSVQLSNQRVRKLAARLADAQPEGQKLKILELGGGAGGLTTHIVSGLNPDRVEYVFSDADESWVEKARQKFRAYPFVDCRTGDPGAESGGLETHGFDLIVVSFLKPGSDPSVEHLQHIKQLLSSQGVLLCLGKTEAAGWQDWVLRTRSRKSDAKECENLEEKLRQAGFADVTRVGGGTANEQEQAVILAQGPKLAEPVSAKKPGGFRPKSPGGWILFCDPHGQGDRLAELLEEAGERCLRVRPGTSFNKVSPQLVEIRPDCLEDMEPLFEIATQEGKRIKGIVHLWGLDAPAPGELTPASLKTAETVGSLSVVHLVNEMAHNNWEEAPRLFLVTRGSQDAGAPQNGLSVAQAPVWGLGQVVQSEHPNLRCRLIDLDPDESSVETLFEELFAEEAPEEIALREGRRYVRRLVRPRPGTRTIDNLPDAGIEAPAYRLETGSPGILDDFKVVRHSRTAPGPGEVEICVEAAGLNFRDVMIAMGLLPGELEGVEQAWETLGLECSGRVSAVGEGVAEFKVGDAVVSLSGGGAFGSYVIAPAFATVRKPERMSFAEAATVPVTFLTAWYMLHRAGRLRAGERALIHAAAGGVGLAAVQIAQLAGAEVYATAGSPEKRGFLRALGVKHVFNSRTLEFADQILEMTQGEGVDLVLNSLSGPFIAKSVGILKPFGRFLEIGKRDIYENNKVGLKPFLKGLSFITMVDIKQGFAEFGQEFRSIFLEIVRHIEEGKLHPLPHRVFPLSNTAGAFRTMAQARHIGKVVVSLRETDLNVIWDCEEPARFDPEATYCITGGLGGFGLATAAWMVRQGARHLALVGRNGAVSDDALEAVAGMKEAGADVQVIAADVSRAEDVERVFERMASVMPPLKGVIHAAMVLDDGLLVHMTPQRLHRVTAPKILGAWNLHRQTLNAPLDFFILFSSIANVIGSPGQGNYVAANAFLEALAQHRRLEGRAGQVINWAPLTEVGVAARQNLNERLEAQGVLSLTPQQAVDMLGRLIQKNPVQTAVFPVKWGKLLSLTRSSKVPAKFAHVLGEESQKELGADANSEVEEPFRPKLMSAPPEERPAILAEHLRKSIAKVLGLAPDKLELDQPLTDVGLDSLMAMELIVRIEMDLEITVPVVRFLGGPSIEQMVPWLIEEMNLNESESLEDSIDGFDACEEKLETERQTQTEEV